MISSTIPYNIWSKDSFFWQINVKILNWIEFYCYIDARVISNWPKYILGWPFLFQWLFFKDCIEYSFLIFFCCCWCQKIIFRQTNLKILSIHMYINAHLISNWLKNFLGWSFSCQKQLKMSLHDFLPFPDKTHFLRTYRKVETYAQRHVCFNTDFFQNLRVSSLARAARGWK